MQPNKNRPKPSRAAFASNGTNQVRRSDSSVPTPEQIEEATLEKNKKVKVVKEATKATVQVPVVPKAEESKKVDDSKDELDS